VNPPCASIRHWLSAYLDGEQSPIPRDAFQRHLESCPACRAEADRLAAFTAAVKAAHRPEAVPPSLEASVARAPPRRPLRRAVLAAAVALATLPGPLAVWLLRPSEASAASMPEAAVLAHEGVRDGSLALDVGLRDPRLLTEWFGRRLPFTFALPRLDNPELELRGGRVIQVGPELAALVVYVRGGEQVSLAVAPRASTAAPPPDGPSEVFRNIRFHLMDLRGLHVISWEDGSLRYSLVARHPADGRASCGICHAPGSGLQDVSLPPR
jgi:anti-sigma factor RsiW